MKFVNNIKTVRQKKGISQQELAEMLGVSQSRVSDIERGRNNVEGYTLGLAYKIANALSCSVDALFVENEAGQQMNNET